MADKMPFPPMPPNNNQSPWTKAKAASKGPMGEPDPYLEVKGGAKCANCSYLEGTNCTHPAVNHDVSPENGYCKYWEQDQANGPTGGPPDLGAPPPNGLHGGAPLGGGLLPPISGGGSYGK